MMSCTNFARTARAPVPIKRAKRASITPLLRVKGSKHNGEQTIAWVGYSWEPTNVVRFETMNGERREISVKDALRQGFFELDTTTPERRDWLQTWASAVTQGPDASFA
jgi:hypothetical protein